jgi:hypothetical protein
MLPTVTTAGGNFLFTFIRDQSSIDLTTTLIIETGENLSFWPQSFVVPSTAVSSDPGVTVIKDIPVAGLDTVTLTLPLVPGVNSFARLKVIP